MVSLLSSSFLVKKFVYQAAQNLYAVLAPVVMFENLATNCARHECVCAIEGVRFLGFDVSALRLLNDAFGKIT